MNSLNIQQHHLVQWCEPTKISGKLLLMTSSNYARTTHKTRYKLICLLSPETAVHDSSVSVRPRARTFFDDLIWRTMSIRDFLKRRRESKKELEPVLPPDGKWGWVVCAAAFLIQFIVLGTMNNFGILYVELFEDFGQKAFLTCKNLPLLF